MTSQFFQKSKTPSPEHLALQSCDCEIHYENLSHQTHGCHMCEWKFPLLWEVGRINHVSHPVIYSPDTCLCGGALLCYGNAFASNRQNSHLEQICKCSTSFFAMDCSVVTCSPVYLQKRVFHFKAGNQGPRFDSTTVVMDEIGQASLCVCLDLPFSIALIFVDIVIHSFIDC